MGESARMLGMDGCTADMADPIAKEWCRTHRIKDDDQPIDLNESRNSSDNSSSRTWSFSSPPPSDKEMHDRYKIYESLAGPNCFHNLLRELSVTEIAVDNHISNFNSDPLPSSDDTTSQGDNRKLYLKLKSTLRRDTLL